MPTEKEYRDEAEKRFKAQDKKIELLTERVAMLEAQLAALTRKP
jgi:hypothetical protein